MSDNLDLQKLKLEERRLEEEIQLRNLEIELRRKELDFQREQYEKSQKEKGFGARIFSPVGVAVIVGLLGLLGTAGSGLLNVYLDHKRHDADVALADRKRESDIILKEADVQDEKQRAKNILWFAQFKYLTLEPGYEQQAEHDIGEISVA